MLEGDPAGVGDVGGVGWGGRVMWRSVGAGRVGRAFGEGMLCFIFYRVKITA